MAAALRPGLVLLLAAVLAAAGCGGDGGGEGPLRVQVAGDPEELAAYRALAAAYGRAGGGRVALIEVGDRRDHLAKLTTSFAARRPPDVFLINHRNIGPFAQRGVIVPAGPRLARAGGLDPADFHAVALEAFRFRGELQCLPQNASSLVVYWNRDRFRRAGVAAPRRGWTYREFLAAARRLGRPSVGIEPSLIRAAPFVWSAGGEVVDDIGTPSRLTLGTPAARRGLAALIGLGREGLAPGRRAEQARSSEERFIAGELAMFFSSRREVPTFRTIEAFGWDVASFPTLVRPASVLHSDGFCVARAGRAEAAGRFVDFAAGPAGQRILARAGRTVPSLRATARSPLFLRDGLPPDSDRVFLDALAHTRRLPTTATWERAEESVGIALEEAFYGAITLDEAIARIERETRGRL